MKKPGEIQVNILVTRFLGWRLPADFNPDGGISFIKQVGDHKYAPTGTNLFDAVQAKAMIEYLLEGMAVAAPVKINANPLLHSFEDAEAIRRDSDAMQLVRDTQRLADLAAEDTRARRVGQDVAEHRKHSHYFKDVSALQTVDVYRVLELFSVVNPCLQHAVKKLLVAAGRGAKDINNDVQEAIDTLERWKEMGREMLCKDEGCDHAGTNHVCVNRAPNVVCKNRSAPYSILPQDVLVGEYPLHRGSGFAPQRYGIQLTHVPSGLVSQCGTERSQHANKQKAWVELEKMVQTWAVTK